MEHQTFTADPANDDQRTDRLSSAVVEAVAEAERVDPVELTPLYTAVDPDALEALFQTQYQGREGPVHGEIRFTYQGYEVRVTADGEVDLETGP